MYALLCLYILDCGVMALCEKNPQGHLHKFIFIPDYLRDRSPPSSLFSFFLTVCVDSAEEGHFLMVRAVFSFLMCIIYFIFRSSLMWCVYTRLNAHVGKGTRGKPLDYRLSSRSFLCIPFRSFIVCVCVTAADGRCHRTDNPLIFLCCQTAVGSFRLSLFCCLLAFTIYICFAKKENPLNRRGRVLRESKVETQTLRR